MQNAEVLKQVLHNLTGALVYTEATNVETNKKLWNQYAKQWKQKRKLLLADQAPQSSNPSNNNNKRTPAHPPAHTNSTHTDEKKWMGSPCAPGNGLQGGGEVGAEDWLERMARHVNRSVGSLEYLGEEWSDHHSLQQVLTEWLSPLLSPEFTVAEIGVGGGRIASYTAARVDRLVAFDISEEMISVAKSSLSAHSNISYHLLETPEFPASFHQTFDFVYSFDVFPHVDLHTLHAYFLSVKTVLKPKGKFFFSVADITKPLGYERFAKQKKYTAAGFYFVCPQIIHTLANKCGYRLVKESREQQDPHAQDANIYYNRDYLCVLELGEE